MIIVLEGLNATGKSSVAEQLHGDWGYPIIRLFRCCSDDHLDGSRVEHLRSLGIPVNTYVEDAFVADFLVRTGAHATLDRSMPSGLAYALVEDRIDSEQVGPLMRLWCDTLRKTKVHVIQLHASRAERERRIEGREIHPQDGILEEWLDEIMELCDLPMTRVDTTTLSKEATLKRCLECLR